MFYLIALTAMLTSLFALLTGFPILGLYQNKRIKNLVETNQLVPEIKNNLDKKLKRKEKGESVIYTPKKWNSNYMIHFIKESSHWKIEIETAMEYRTVVINVVDGQIFNVRTNSKMREKENQIKRQVELLEKTILEIIEKLDSLEMGRNNEQHGSTEMENLYALKEALIMTQDLTFKENEIQTYHVGRYSIEFSIQDKKRTLFINKEDEILYRVDYHQTDDKFKNEKNYQISAKEENEYLEREIIPTVKRTLKKLKKYEINGEKLNHNMIWEKKIEEYLQKNNNKEMQKEYEIISNSYHKMNQKYQENNKELYEKALKKLHDTKEEKIQLYAD